MAKNLVIVESPAKAKTIEGFLGPDFTVKSSFGHIRDLSKEKNGVDIARGYEPIYEVSEDKTAVVSDLRKAAKLAEMVWLASDEDREGEAISWHLKEALGLEEAKIKRIVFHEITKRAITHAIENPRRIDQDLVDAQQARRVLDRLVGFEISPVLWKKVRPSLSAGRVQSVAVRLIVEREREVDAFKSESAFRVVALFQTPSGAIAKAELPKRFATEPEATAFLEACAKADFRVESVEKKPFKRTPVAPFTTSTLQQEASRKLYMSVQRTMVVAQKLYEAGKITYMRTDSVNLSQDALEASKKEVYAAYGEKYHKERKYKTKSDLAQEAHEAIRPTYFENHTIDGDKDEKNLYELIWKRAIASQMADAELERTTVQISISTSQERYVASGEVLKFDGFLKVYLASKDEDDGPAEEESGLLPAMTENDILKLQNVTATERFTQPPARFTEASLVKKLEELGIGRPSTYAPTIGTVQKRGYVEKTDRVGRDRQFVELQLNGSDIQREVKTQVTGAEKSKLFPTDVGILVTDFLKTNFPDILDLHFTAKVEKDFDEIAQGRLAWKSMLDEFYKPFHQTVEKTILEGERVTGERMLGTDPESGRPLLVRMGRFGPIAQIGASDDENKRFASLRATQKLESITAVEALELFKLPRIVGELEGQVVKASVGRFGPYLQYNGKFYSLPKGGDPFTVTTTEAADIIAAKDISDKEKELRLFDERPEIKIVKGRWGPFLSVAGKAVKTAKAIDLMAISLDEVEAILAEAAALEAANKKKGRAKPKAVAEATAGATEDKPVKKAAAKTAKPAAKAATKPKTAAAKKPTLSKSPKAEPKK